MQFFLSKFSDGLWNYELKMKARNAHLFHIKKALTANTFTPAMWITFAEMALIRIEGN